MSKIPYVRLCAALALGSLAVWLGLAAFGPAMRAGDVPYVTTRPAVVERMLQLADVGSDDFVFDLGSGDGRIVIAAASLHGARGRGFEIDPELVRVSRERAEAAGVAGLVEFVEGDLFAADLREATAVTLYLLPTVNLEVRPMLFEQLAPGTRVVSQSFAMAEWRPDRVEVMPLEPPAELYVWTMPVGAGGVWDVDLPNAAVLGSVAEQPVIRMLQRFQDLEGVLSFMGREVPIIGTVHGRQVVLRTTREHPELGRLALTGEVDGHRFEGEVRAHTGPSATRVGPADELFRARRRAADISGIWDIGPSVEPFVPHWSIHLQHDGTRWAGTRSSVSGVVPSGARMPGAPPAGQVAARDGEPVAELYVLGSSVSIVVSSAVAPTRRIVYHGLVDGDRINGEIHHDGGLVRWAAVRRRGAGS